MPIKIPNALPAATQLQAENIFIMTEKRATTQHIRHVRSLRPLLSLRQQSSFRSFLPTDDYALKKSLPIDPWN